MDDMRQKEILSFFASVNEYKDIKPLNKNFLDDELVELRNEGYLTCMSLRPLQYVVSIKGYRFLRNEH